MQAQGFTVGASILGQCSTTSIFGLPTSHVPQPALPKDCPYCGGVNIATPNLRSSRTAPHLKI